jgi:hypothetical protein
MDGPSAIITTAPHPSADEHMLGKRARSWKLGCPPPPGASGSKDIARNPVGDMIEYERVGDMIEYVRAERSGVHWRAPYARG